MCGGYKIFTLQSLLFNDVIYTYIIFTFSVKDETNTNTQPVDKKGEVEKMEKETEDKCEPSN